MNESERSLLPTENELAQRLDRTRLRMGSEAWKTICELNPGPLTDDLICRLHPEKLRKPYSTSLDSALFLWKEARIQMIASNDPEGQSQVIVFGNRIFSGSTLALAICRAYVGSRYMGETLKTSKTVQAWAMAQQFLKR